MLWSCVCSYWQGISSARGSTKRNWHPSRHCQRVVEEVEEEEKEQVPEEPQEKEGCAAEATVAPVEVPSAEGEAQGPAEAVRELVL